MRGHEGLAGLTSGGRKPQDARVTFSAAAPHGRPPEPADLHSAGDQIQAPWDQADLYSPPMLSRTQVTAFNGREIPAICVPPRCLVPQCQEEVSRAQSVVSHAASQGL